MNLRKCSMLLFCVVSMLFAIVAVHAAPIIFVVSPYQKVTQLFRQPDGSTILDSGSTVSGSISISGGQGNDIIFYVTDPANVTIAGFGDTKNTEFSFVIPTTGEYTAHFDNSFSQDPKGVSFDYSMTPPILGIPQMFFYAILAIILLAAIIIVTAAFILRRRRKRQREKDIKWAAQKSL